MALLDLSIHEVEDITGKEVVFNDTRYELLRPIGEGGEAWIFPLRNIRTRLIQFVAKLYKCAPDSPEGVDILRRTSGDVASMGFVLKIAGIDSALPDEICAYGGGLFRLQRLVVGVDDPEDAFQLGRMKRAAQLVDDGKYLEAIAVYDDVLTDNPKHTVALGNRALCMAHDELSPAALVPLITAIDLEPNDTELVVKLVGLYRSLGWPRQAIAAVEKSLSLWRWRYDVWTAGMDLALDWDLVDYAQRELARLQNAVPNAKIISGYSERLETSRERSRQFELEMTRALQCLQREEFAVAEGHLRRAEAASLRNELARANLAVCKYHLGEFNEAMDLILPLLVSEVGNSSPAVAMLSILATFNGGNPTAAAGLLELIDDSPGDVFDLPCVPVAVLESGALEYPSVVQITEMLESLLEVDGAPKPRIRRLIALYVEYESRLSETAG